MSQWYVHHPDGTQAGPISTEAVIANVKAGGIPEGALVCEVGGSEWRPLAEVPTLAQASTSGAPAEPSGKPAPALAPSGRAPRPTRKTVLLGVAAAGPTLALVIAGGLHMLLADPSDAGWNGFMYEHAGADSAETAIFGVLAEVFVGAMAIAIFVFIAKRRRDPGMRAKLAVLVGLVAGPPVGLLVSQYAPILGTLEKIGRPWSRARTSLVGGHALLFAVVGAVSGLLVAWLLAWQPKVAPDVRRGGDVATRLRELQGLREQGLLSDAEYEAKRAEILGSI